jgi:hypothetical protein
MRAKRLQALLAEGWIKGSGSSSAKVRLSRTMAPLAHPFTVSIACLAGRHERG